MKFKGRREAVICDVDGTLADVSSIRHLVDGINSKKDFNAFHKASEFVPAHRQAVEFCIRHHKAGDKVLILTARMRMWEGATARFLERELVPHAPYVAPIWMRADGDYRKDYEVKKEILAAIRQTYNVVAACDDNPNVITLWEEEGIPEIEIIPGWDVEAAAKYAAAANRSKER